MQSNQQICPAVQATRASARLHDTARAGFHYDKMKTMIAKYPGFCRACQQPIERGQSINFFGKGQAEHTTCGKPAEQRQEPDHFDMLVEDNMRDACGL